MDWNKKQDELINKHIKPMFSGLRAASITHFLETGAINGSFRQALLDMMNEQKTLLTENQSSKEWEQRVKDKFPTLEECKKAATDYADKKDGNEYFLSEYGRTFKAYQEGINWGLNYVNKNQLSTDWEQRLVEYCYDFAWHYGRLWHIGDADKIKAAINEKFQLPEEAISNILNGK